MVEGSNQHNNINNQYNDLLSSQQSQYWTHERYRYSNSISNNRRIDKLHYKHDNINKDNKSINNNNNTTSSQQYQHQYRTALTSTWRNTDKVKTVGCALIACLNIGVDPPDIVKPSPSSKLECWIDIDSMPASKALRAIGLRLQQQYERWHERCKYTSCLDPTADDVRKLCSLLRRTCGDERALFHYNGHGVPRPTNSGEIWVYNKGYTQYIPISLYDIQTWLQVDKPAIYVLDVNNGGLVVEWFMNYIKQRNIKTQQQQQQLNNNINQPQANAHPINITSALDDDCRHILLASCSSNETLPMTPDLPSDLFTSCLTTPIRMALRWFVQTSSLVNVTSDSIDRIPGIRKPANRKLPFGELNWIFTAITDTIAWSVLPNNLFQKLYRQDLLVASLFRNYLLAERIFHSLNLHVVSHPALPSTYNHSLWSSWDQCVDQCISQLHKYIINDTPFIPSTFFEDQLTSFELWLEYGNERQVPPLQLPIVLQVLLSADHRLRALQLLSQYIDNGSWAIESALCVGIFPYILKLLQSPAKELREVLVFIWCKILSYDITCQNDLSRIEYTNYFVQHLLHYQAPALHNNISNAMSPATYGIINNTSPSQSNVVYNDTQNTFMTLAESVPPPTTAYLQAPTSLYTNTAGQSPPFHALPSPAVLNDNHTMSWGSANTQHHHNNQQNSSSPMQSPLLNNNTQLPTFDGSTYSSPGHNNNIQHSISRQTAIALHNNEFQWVISCYIICMICHDNVKGQQTVLSTELADFNNFVIPHINSNNSLLRLWICFTISKLWFDNNYIKTIAYDNGIIDKLLNLCNDKIQEVRATALYTVSSWFGGSTLINDNNSNTDTYNSNQQQQQHTSPLPPQQQQQHYIRNLERMDIELDITNRLLEVCINDASPLVRLELVNTIANLIWEQKERFVDTITTFNINTPNINTNSESPRSIRQAYQQQHNNTQNKHVFNYNINNNDNGNDDNTNNHAPTQHILDIWHSLHRLSRDPCQSVEQTSELLIKYIKGKVSVREQFNRMMNAKHAPNVYVQNNDNDNDIDNNNHQATHNQQSQANDNNPLTLHDHAAQFVVRRRSNSPGSAFKQPNRNSVANLPLRHFDRFALANMRAHLAPSSSAAATSSATSTPTTQQNRTLNTTENTAAASQTDASNNTTSATTDAQHDTHTTKQQDTAWNIQSSTLFQDTCLYFNKPLLKQQLQINSNINNQQQQYSNTLVHTIQQLQRNKQMRVEHNKIDDYASRLRTMSNINYSKTYYESAIYDSNYDVTGCLLWHPYDTVLYAADGNKSNISVWQYGSNVQDRNKERINKFVVDNHNNSRINTMHLVDDTSNSMLIVGSDDGCIRIVKNIRDDRNTKLVTSWVANPMYNDIYAPKITQYTVKQANNNNILNNNNNIDDDDNNNDEDFDDAEEIDSYDGDGYSATHYLSTFNRTRNKSLNSNSSVNNDDNKTTKRQSSKSASVLKSMQRIGSDLSLINKNINNNKHNTNNKSSFYKLQSSASSANLTSSFVNFTNAITNPANILLNNNNNAISSRNTSSSTAISHIPLLKRKLRKPPIITQWLSQTGKLIVSGNGNEIIRIWDVENEKLECSFNVTMNNNQHNINTINDTSCITSMTCDHTSSLLYAGCKDGMIRLYDIRTNPSRAYVGIIRQHTSSIHTVCLQRGGIADGNLVSSSITGEIILSDARVTNRSLVTLQRNSHINNTMSSFTVHEWAPLMASGTHNKPFIEVFDINGMTLDTIKYHTGFLGQRLSSVNTLAFHPKRLLLAAGYVDNYISVFASERNV